LSRFLSIQGSQLGHPNDFLLDFLKILEISTLKNFLEIEKIVKTIEPESKKFP
jgi:hypothetical protein